MLISDDFQVLAGCFLKTIGLKMALLVIEKLFPLMEAYVNSDMDVKTQGAWLLAHSKSLDAVNGAGRLENIQYAGRVGRLYNLLRRNIQGVETPTINSEAVKQICQLNGIDRSAREAGLQCLKTEGRIDLASNGGVAVLGATAPMVLETTAKIFESTNPTNEERAVIDVSEKIASRPGERGAVTEFVSDVYEIAISQVSELVNVCKNTAIFDQVEDRGRFILFNNNTFRDAGYAVKAYWLIQSLNSGEQSKLAELQEKMASLGTVCDSDAINILGGALYSRLVGVGFFDRLEVSNSTEAVGYITSPDSFQKFGRPFENDPVDDAKALLASLTYGMTRSTSARGQITMPSALLRKLVEGCEVGGDRGVRAIGEDYKELERRQVIKVTEKAAGRYVMKLLKKDVGDLALSIINGNVPAHEAILMDGAAASSFKGPAVTSKEVREKYTVHDSRFLHDALDRLRSGG